MGYTAAVLRRCGEISKYANSEYSRCFHAQLNRRMSTATRSGAASSPPWLMLPPTLDGRGNIAHTFHCLARNEYLVKKNNFRGGGGGGELAADINDVKIAGSSHGWLAFSDWSNHEHLYLSNPITDRHVRLPPPPQTMFGGAADRVILTSPISDSEEGEEATAFMIFESAGRGRLAFCRPSQPGTEWTRMGELDDVYETMVYSTTHKRLFCTMRRNYTSKTLECWDVGVSRPPTLDWVIEGNPRLNFEYTSFPEMSEFKTKCFQMSYLVCAEHSGELFYIVRHVNRRMGPYGPFSVAEKVKDEDEDDYANYHGDEYDYAYEYKDENENEEIVGYPYKTVDFDVYKIDTVTGVVTHVKRSLKGLAIFVGINHPFAMIPGGAGVKPNSIYFTDENRFVEATRLEEATGFNYGGHDNGIFDYRNKEFSAICDDYPIENHKIRKILPLPMWFTPTTL